MATPHPPPTHTHHTVRRTCEALEAAVEKQVLAPRECLPQQVVLRAHAHDAVDVAHVARDVGSTYECSACRRKEKRGGQQAAHRTVL